MPDDEKEFVELFYNYKKYLVRKSDVDDKRNKVILLPDGTVFNLAQMYVDTTDRHGSKLERPCFRGSNPDYKVWGKLPVFNVVKVEAVVEQGS